MNRIKSFYIILIGLVISSGIIYAVFQKPFFYNNPPVKQVAAPKQNPQGSYKVSRPDWLFLAMTREILAKDQVSKKDKKDILDAFAKINFPKEFYGAAVTAYRPGVKRIRSVSTKKAPSQDVISAMEGITRNKHYGEFDFRDPETRLQIDFIIEEPKTIDFKNLSQRVIGDNRLEVGVDGLLVVHKDKKLYFLPGDAFTQSILSIDQLNKYISKQFKNVPVEKMAFQRFHTRSFISYLDTWLELYRGYPVTMTITKPDLESAVRRGVDFVSKNQKPDGQFLYYYDAAKDSYVDHDHPKRDPVKDPYYNILRHCGGVLLLLYDYRISGDKKLLGPTMSGIDFLIKQIKTYRLPDGAEAAYVYYNRKAKLGGSGIALYMLSEYQHLTGDRQYERYAILLARHLLNQILNTGEFIYYHIYLDKEIKTAEDNHKLFNFYYPGEAVMGLAGYYKYVATDKAEKKNICEKLDSALNFLLVERPALYKDQYVGLPSDSWLMMGINELWDAPEMRKDMYKDFVYHDADQMVTHMYTEKDALYPDYAGAFYYNYGDEPYPDGARAEGLTAALELAHKVGDKERYKKYHDALKLVALATYRLCNTPESVYSIPQPDKAIGGIRFKPTRQWFRIDTIQHVAAFFQKFLPYWEG